MKIMANCTDCSNPSMFKMVHLTASPLPKSCIMCRQQLNFASKRGEQVQDLVHDWMISPVEVWGEFCSCRYTTVKKCASFIWLKKNADTSLDIVQYGTFKAKSNQKNLLMIKHLPDVDLKGSCAIKVSLYHVYIFQVEISNYHHLHFCS